MLIAQSHTGNKIYIPSGMKLLQLQRTGCTYKSISFPYTHTHTHAHIYTRVCLCVCVCVIDDKSWYINYNPTEMGGGGGRGSGGSCSWRLVITGLAAINLSFSPPGTHTHARTKTHIVLRTVCPRGPSQPLSLDPPDV